MEKDIQIPEFLQHKQIKSFDIEAHDAELIAEVEEELKEKYERKLHRFVAMFLQKFVGIIVITLTVIAMYNKVLAGTDFPYFFITLPLGLLMLFYKHGVFWEV